VPGLKFIHLLLVSCTGETPIESNAASETLAVLPKNVDRSRNLAKSVTVE
jgi:hypothetical protein